MTAALQGGLEEEEPRAEALYLRGELSGRRIPSSGFLKYLLNTNQ